MSQGVFTEGVGLLKAPSFLVTSILCVVLATWAWRMLCQLGQANRKNGES